MVFSPAVTSSRSTFLKSLTISKSVGEGHALYLWIDGKGSDSLFPHSQAKLSLDERGDHQRHDMHGQKSDDSFGFFEVDRCDLLIGLDLRMALLEKRLKPCLSGFHTLPLPVV